MDDGRGLCGTAEGERGGSKYSGFETKPSKTCNAQGGKEPHNYMPSTLKLHTYVTCVYL